VVFGDGDLKPLTKYKFEVRAQSVSQEGKWSELSEYIGMFIFLHIRGTNFILIEWHGPLPKIDRHPQLGASLSCERLLTVNNILRSSRLAYSIKPSL